MNKWFCAVAVIGAMSVASPANAASIVFSQFSYSTPVKDYAASSNSRFGEPSRDTLKALAQASDFPGNESSIVTVRTTSTFTVNPTGNEKAGQKVEGKLEGVLQGILRGEVTRSEFSPNASYFASVSARVNAGPLSWASPIQPNQINFTNITETYPVRQIVSDEAQLTIGDTYNFDMVLSVRSSVTGEFVQSVADFYSSGDNNRRFYATVKAVPEPSETLGLITVLGVGYLIKKRRTNKVGKVH